MTPRRISVAAAFASYRQAVMHPDASPTQITETRRAFYAGMLEALEIFETAPLDDAVHAINALRAELDRFFAKDASQ